MSLSLLGTAKYLFLCCNAKYGKEHIKVKSDVICNNKDLND